MAIARRLYEDVLSLKIMDMDGYVEDGSQRSGFPNAFPVYVYASTLLDRNADFEKLKEDYFSHIYGEDWQSATDLLQKITDAFDFKYMEGESSVDVNVSKYYDPERVERLRSLFELAKLERELVNEHLNMEYRPQTVSWRLLLRHAEYVEKWAEIMIEKAIGNNEKAKELAVKFCDDFGKYELEIERYYDHSLTCRSLEHLTRKTRKVILD
jgi:hypothetical protein